MNDIQQEKAARRRFNGYFIAVAVGVMGLLIVGTIVLVLSIRTAPVQNPTIDTSKCWNQVITEDTQYYWRNGCRGEMTTPDQVCTMILVPLTSDEIDSYLEWVDAGSPEILGCAE